MSATPPGHGVNILTDDRANSLELPTDSSNRLTLSTLQGYFPGVVGLKYASSTGTMRLLQKVNEGGETFLVPPCAGWRNKDFFLVYPMPNPSEINFPILSTAHYTRFTPLIFHTRILTKNKKKEIVEKDVLRNACTPFQSNMFPGITLFATCRHGAHECLALGDVINIYNYLGNNHFQVKVVDIHKDLDFVVLYTKTKVLDNLPRVAYPTGGMNYLMLGYPDVKQAYDDGMPSFAAGVVLSSALNSTGHFCGTSGGMEGFSGGPLFSLDEGSVLGICISTDDLDDKETSLGKFTTTMITYCKKITVCRILPVKSVESILYAKYAKGGF